MSEALPPVSRLRKCLGWAVHAYTGSGLVLAAWVTSLLLQTERTADTYRLCLLLMLVAVIIQGKRTQLPRI